MSLTNHSVKVNVNKGTLYMPSPFNKHIDVHTTPRELLLFIALPALLMPAASLPFLLPIFTSYFIPC
jgi:hypothetical protein